MSVFIKSISTGGHEYSGEHNHNRWTENMNMMIRTQMWTGRPGFPNRTWNTRVNTVNIGSAVKRGNVFSHHQNTKTGDEFRTCLFSLWWNRNRLLRQQLLRLCCFLSVVQLVLSVCLFSAPVERLWLYLLMSDTEPVKYPFKCWGRSERHD